MNQDVRTFSVILQGEKSCLLSDIECVKEEIIIVDNENKNLKRFTTYEDFLDTLLLNDPYGITSLMLTSHVVVTEPDIKTISFVSIDGHLALSSRRRVSKKYKSVCCIDDTRLAVGCCEVGSASVDIIDYIGNVLRTIEHTLTPESVFKTPVSVSVTKDKCILISDSGLEKLLGITIKGEVVSEFDLSGSPRGVTVDNSGAIYLCLNDRDCINVSNSYNKKPSRTLPGMNLKHPLAITHSKNLLIITEDTPSDKVTLFKIDSDKDGRDIPVRLSHIELCVMMAEDDDDD